MKIYSNNVNRIGDGFLIDIQIVMTYFDAVDHDYLCTENKYDLTIPKNSKRLIRGKIGAR